MRRSLVLFALLLSCGSPHGTDGAKVAAPPSASSGPAVAGDDLPEAPRDPREPVLAEAAVEILAQHVLAKPVDDAVSKEAFHRMIADLDDAKLFLLESDVQKLARFDTQMDDELQTGDLV
ncbi:MAG TPA: hypothetical protein VIF62_05495, partial [Labilithrix sp.]